MVKKVIFDSICTIILPIETVKFIIKLRLFHFFSYQRGISETYLLKKGGIKGREEERRGFEL